MTRYTIRDFGSPGWLSGWLYELPYRRKAWWREALFAPGEGWLRWAPDEAVTECWESNACAWYPEYHRVVPPLRRLTVQLGWCVRGLLFMWREKLSWEEAGPNWDGLRADPERRKTLWGRP